MDNPRLCPECRRILRGKGLTSRQVEQALRQMRNEKDER